MRATLTVYAPPVGPDTKTGRPHLNTTILNTREMATAYTHHTVPGQTARPDSIHFPIRLEKHAVLDFMP